MASNDADKGLILHPPEDILLAATEACRGRPLRSQESAEKEQVGAWFVAMVVKEDPTPWNLNSEKVNEVVELVVDSLYSLDGFQCRRGYDAMPCCGIVDVCYPYAFPQTYQAALEKRLRHMGLKLAFHSESEERPAYDVHLVDPQSSWALHQEEEE